MSQCPKCKKDFSGPVCPDCVETLVRACGDVQASNFYKRLLSGINGEQRASFIKWAEGLSAETGAAKEICVLRAIAGVAIIRRENVYNVFCNMIAAHSVRAILPPETNSEQSFSRRP